MPVTVTEPATGLTPPLEQYRAEIEALVRDAHELVADLTEEQVNWRPAPHRWSIAQCLSHIVLTTRAYLAGLDSAIAEAKERGAAGLAPYRQSFVSNRLVRSMEPPPGFKIKTFRSLEPLERFKTDDLLAAFVSVLNDLTERLRRAAGVDLDGGRMRSPFIGLLRMTIDQAIRLQLAHTRRHLWQARQVRQSPTFPSRA
jgi:hypothetical protein